MSHREEMRDFVNKLQRTGCEIKYSGSGHWKIKAPGGEVIICSSTPRDTRRAIKNTAARLRRAGVDIK